MDINAGRYLDGESMEQLTAESLDLVIATASGDGIAFARALLCKPDWLFMDEGTASLDEGAEARLYTLLRTQLPGTTVVSIGHRPALAQYHDQRVSLVRENGVGRLVLA